MDTRADGWDAIIDRALAREVAGELDSSLVARLEERLERDEAPATQPARDLTVYLLPWLAVWIILAAALIMLHVRLAPGDYAALGAALQPILEEARPDLIAAAAATFGLAEATARFTGRGPPRRGGDTG